MSDETQSAEAGNDTLAAALARHEIELPREQVELLDRYCRSLWDWNSKLNLTRHTTYEKFVTRDVVDSLRFAAALEPKERVLDLGTGGGVPGVVLAIVRRDLKVTLSESVAKKARAVEAIVGEVGLPATVYHGRGEDLLAKQKFDTVAVRAVAPLVKLLTWFKPHWGSFRRLLVIKGPQWTEERGEARHRGLLKPLELRVRDKWPMHGTESESVLLEIWPK